MDLLQRIALTVVLSCCSESAIAQQTPSQQTPSQQTGANPPAHTESWWTSPWGKDDRLGNVNNLSAEGVKRATGLVKTGKVYALGIPTAPESAAYGTRQYAVERTPGPDADYTPNGSQRVTAFDEKVSSSMGVGTQIDGFGHLGQVVHEVPCISVHRDASHRQRCRPELGQQQQRRGTRNRDLAPLVPKPPQQCCQAPRRQHDQAERRHLAHPPWRPHGGEARDAHEKPVGSALKDRPIRRQVDYRPQRPHPE